jgi:predicted ATP-binding protein involved in virulence
MLYSCDNSDFEYENSFKKSYAKWSEFKAKSNNSYKYITKDSSWTGAKWETTTTINNGEVVQRSFKYVYITDEFKNYFDGELEWVENKEELNTHRNTEASEPLTLDEVYQKAEQDWLQKRKDTETYFETKNDGLISLCGFRPDDCMDDCGSPVKSCVLKHKYF